MAKSMAERAREHRSRVAERERAAADLLVLLLAAAPDLVKLAVEGNAAYRSAIAVAERVRGAA
jgi:hypothetical protein